MKLHLVFYCTGLCEPRCNELHVTFVYKMDADMYKAGKTILSLSLFSHFAVVFKQIFFGVFCVQAYTIRQESHIIVFQIWNRF